MPADPAVPRPAPHGPAGGRVRVCIVAPSLDILGGQAVAARALLTRLREVPSLDVDFLPHNPRLPGPLRALQRVKYVRTVATSAAYVSSLLARLGDYDVVHLFSAAYWSFVLAPLPALLVGRAKGRRVVLNYHSGELEDHLRRWPRSTALMRRADEIVVQSGYLVDVFARFGMRARAIYNFVDADAQPYRRRAPLRPLFLANRNFQKHYNVASVLRAFALIRERAPDARLAVAGDGPERDALHALARELGLGDSVRFLGPLPPGEMPARYDAADVYLNGSDLDNMPLSIIEAFTAGLPVVTTDAGGIPYVVRHEENGLLVQRGDPRAMADAALRLLADPELAVRLADAARREALARYAWPAVRDEWERLYLDLAARDGRGAGR
jgi:glycosyltransferase involved in cell wall biosynthesis